MTSTIKVTNDRAAVVDQEYFWRRIDRDVPVGVKLQLINEHYGVAVYGTLSRPKDKFFTHWAPLPKFPEEE